MRVYAGGRGWNVRRVRRRQWTPGTVILAALLGIVALTLVIALLLMALAAAAVLGAAYLGYRSTRRLLAGSRRPAVRSTGRRADPELRGFVEMARTPDPLDRYLLAVHEFDRLSGATLSVDPAGLTGGRAARRAADLAEQAYNLVDAVNEIERQLSADPSAEKALANVWELSVAAGELWSYCRDLRDARHDPSLAQVRWFISRRTALLNRRDALVARLRDTELHASASVSSQVQELPKHR